MNSQEREMQIEFINNVYKDIHGVRPRHVDFASMTDQEIDQMAADVVNEGQSPDDVDFSDDADYMDDFDLFQQYGVA